MTYLAVNLVYVNEPVVTMRESPTIESKVESQAIFSEKVTVLEKCGNWSHIVTSDDYRGWAPSQSLITRDTPYTTSLKVSRLQAHLYGIQDTEFGPIATLPYGSSLQVLDKSHPRWIHVSLLNGKMAYIQRGDVSPEQELHHKEELVQFSRKFLNLPYTWGGRSSFGYDCAGFVQMLYNQIGIQLPRNSRDQAIDGRFKTIPIQNLEPGDLLFWGTAEGRIVHTGMYLGNSQFIHTSPCEVQPWLRISNLSDAKWNGQPSSSLPLRIAKQVLK